MGLWSCKRRAARTSAGPHPRSGSIWFGLSVIAVEQRWRKDAIRNRPVFRGFHKDEIRKLRAKNLLESHPKRTLPPHPIDAGRTSARLTCISKYRIKPGEVYEGHWIPRRIATPDSTRGKVGDKFVGHPKQVQEHPRRHAPAAFAPCGSGSAACFL